jgi:hypothetical protein
LPTIGIPKKSEEALIDPDWVIAKQDDLNQFERQKPLKLRTQTTRQDNIWYCKGFQKLDEIGIVTRDKAKLVATGYYQVEGIDDDGNRIFGTFKI